MTPIEAAAAWYAKTGVFMSETQDIVRGVVLAFLDATTLESVARGLCNLDIEEFRDPDKMVRTGEGNHDFEPVWRTHQETAAIAVAAIRALAEKAP